LHELPLLAFTLLGQAAAGLAMVAPFTQSLSRPVFGTIGALILAAVLVSLLHLGSGSRAWRTSANLKRSALSQEIVALGTFAAAWVIAALAPVAGRIALALAGLALVYCMAEVYRIDAVPGWTIWRTRAAFGSSTLFLGLLVHLGNRWVAQEPVPGWLVAIAGPALIAQQIHSRRRFYQRLHAKAM
jgi:anaerobic dimethyl sulfoxide reductase subunit C (anchor subunit)